MDCDNADIDFSRKKTDMLIKGIQNKSLKPKIHTTSEWSDLINKAEEMHGQPKKSRINWFKIVYENNGYIKTF